MLRDESPQKLEERQRKQFPEWFKTCIAELHSEGLDVVTDELYALSFGPSEDVGLYTTYNANGIRWHVKKMERTRSVQNSGIMAPGSHGQGESNFYGRLVSIVKLDFAYGYSVHLFKCKWFSTINTKKRKRFVRDYHLRSVNENVLWYEDNPYILPTQAQQIFYLDDPKLNSGWKVIQTIRHRHVWDVPENEQAHVAETSYADVVDQEVEVENVFLPIQDDNVDPVTSYRGDGVPEMVTVSHEDRQSRIVMDVDFIDDSLIPEEPYSEIEEDCLDSDEDSDLDV